MREQRGAVILKPVAEKQRMTARRQAVHDLMDKPLRHGQTTIPDSDMNEQLADRINGGPNPARAAR